MGDYVFVARVRRHWFSPELVSKRTGHWRVVTAAQEQEYGVQKIISRAVRDVMLLACELRWFRHRRHAGAQGPCPAFLLLRGVRNVGTRQKRNIAKRTGVRGSNPVPRLGRRRHVGAYRRYLEGRSALPSVAIA